MFAENELLRMLNEYEHGAHCPQNPSFNVDLLNNFIENRISKR